MTERVAIIATVLNEAKSAPAWLDSIANQTRRPDEVVIVDGGSRDDTLIILHAYQDRLPVKVISLPGANISQGRNRAIAESICEIIASTDAGVRLEPDWLAHLLTPFEQDPATQAVAGFFQGDPNLTSPFEVAMSATVLPMAEDINPATFLPSSRSVAFRKTLWETIGGYPEWLDYCEDLIFDFRVRAHIGSFTWQPNAIAHFKPRTTLKGYYRQYYLYARGDGKADLWRKRHAARYITYLVLIPLILALVVLIHPLFLLLYIVGGVIYLKQPYQRLPRIWGRLGVRGKLQSLIWIVIIRVVGDVAKMMGYPVGWRWRRQNHPPNWHIRNT
ncbi:MAG: glycosyl transferase family 2 [Chloroflexi bacterium]|nr:glycosyl transferase family 2 [Chloroflexota bacterium]